MEKALQSRRLPSGLVAFVFTDLEGSTTWWERDPGGMSTSLRLHDDLTRAVIDRHGGVVFGALGDGFAAAFHDLSSALGAATELRERLATVDWQRGPVLLVRMGVHLGEAEWRDDNYFGTAVNVAARVCAAGHGGQTLVTELVRSTAGLEPHPVGEYRLRVGMYRFETGDRLPVDGNGDNVELGPVALGP